MNHPPSFPPPPLPPGAPPHPPPLPLPPPGMPPPPPPPPPGGANTAATIIPPLPPPPQILLAAETTPLPNLNYHPQNSAQVVLLSHLPPFLRSIRTIREAAFPACGSTARTVHLGCCAPPSDTSEEWRKMKERGLITGLMMTNDDDVDKINSSSSGGNATEKQIMEALHWTGAKGGVAVIKMNHYIGAKNFAGALLALRKCSLENEGKGSMPSMQIIEPAAADDGDEEGGGAADVNKNNDEVTATELTPQETAIKEESSNEDKQEENVAVDNKQTTTTTTIVTKEEEKKPEYTKEEEAQHLTTLQQLQQMRIYHLANYHIPDPPNIPPDMTIPQPDPIPQDPSIIFRLLESLTTLRLRYEEGRRTNNTSSNGGGGMEEQHKTNNNNDDQWGGHAAAATGDNPDDTSNNHHGLKLDKDKIAAAAGGGAYDEDADPLNAPDVVNAVLEFKRKLETRDVTSRRRRVDIITDRMAKKVREFVEQGRNERRKREEMQRQLQQQQQQQQHHQQQQQQQLAESSTIATTVNVADSGQRGVSNLPAWMTNNNANGNGAEASAATTTTAPSTTQTKPQDDEEEGTRKRKFVPSEANRDINVRKQRLDVEGGQSLSEIRAANEAADKQAAAAAASFVAQTTKEGILSADSKFPPLSTAVDSLKTYVTAQIVDYLGEEEKTLIDFIMKELAKEGGCNTSSMLDEMKMVLDEDAEDFVVNLYHKMAAT